MCYTSSSDSDMTRDRPAACCDFYIFIQRQHYDFNYCMLCTYTSVSLFNKAQEIHVWRKKTPISLSLFLKGSQLNFPKDAASLLFACKRYMGLGHSMIRRQQKKSGVIPHFLVIQPAKNVFWITQGVREQWSINLMQRTYSCLLMERSSSHNTHTQ